MPRLTTVLDLVILVLAGVGTTKVLGWGWACIVLAALLAVVSYRLATRPVAPVEEPTE